MASLEHYRSKDLEFGLEGVIFKISNVPGLISVESISLFGVIIAVLGDSPLAPASAELFVSKTIGIVQIGQ